MIYAKQQQRGILGDTALGYTALILAAMEGHLALVQWLLREGGANTTEKARSGNTALLWAAREGHLNIVQWLLLYGGAQITESNDNGDTALLWAAYKGHLKIVQWLLREGGAKITDKTRRGGTALLAAATTRRFETVDCLIVEFGADPGNGIQIAQLLGTVGNEQLRKAEELRNLFYEYYKKQQHKINKQLLEVGLADLVIKDVRNIIEEYTAVNDEEKPSLPQQILAQNESLLKELKAYSKQWDSFVKWHKLARKLVDKIALENPCNALTIRTTVKDFLAEHREDIGKGEFFIILQNMLHQTHSLELSTAEGLTKEEIKENKKGALPLKNAKASRVTRLDLSPSPSPTNATTTLIPKRNGIADQKLKSAPPEDKKPQPLTSIERMDAITALCHATTAGNLTEIETWLERDLSLMNGAPSKKKIPLFSALKSANSDAFHHLLSKGAYVCNKRGYILAENMALLCQWPLVEKLAALEALAKKTWF